MTEADMKARLQSAQDMVDVLTEQRNGIANQIVQIGAQLKSSLRRTAELEARNAELEAKLKTDEEPQLPLSPKVAANGHAEQAH